MGRRILAHLRSHVIAHLALFFALTGTAIALPGTNTVFTNDIVNGDVKSSDIANGKVNTIDLQDNQVRSNDVRDDTLANGGLGAADLAPGSVDSSEIVAGAVRGSELLNYHVHSGTAVSVNDARGLNGDWTQATATASCTPGEQLVGAYAQWTTAGDEVATQEIIRDFSANSVTARGIQDDGGVETFQASAVCMFD